MASCPALLIAAPASGVGKTSVAAALARLHARAGRRVRMFKCGPDFLDPMIQAAASGWPCENLDLWMCGEADCAARLARAAGDADLILVEGMMGLFDGQPSAADIAQRFGLPVLAVIDASAMAQTFAAIAYGLRHFHPELPFHGVLANQVAGPGHAALLRAALPEELRWCGALMRDETARLPERHLGLNLASEIDDLLVRIDRLADQLAATPLAHLPPAVPLTAAEFGCSPALLKGKRIAIARDAAYAFIYPANLECLTELGAELIFFAPLSGEALPDCDALWLPGGYPELHAPRLARQAHVWQQLRAHVAAGKPVLAECGGMMSLFDTLTDQSGQSYRMAGLLPGACAMRARLTAIGPQQAALPEGRLRGHTFHYSSAQTPLVPLATACRPDGTAGEAVYRQARLTASYLHFYFPSNPVAAAGLFLA